jgi:hypothetical protein
MRTASHATLLERLAGLFRSRSELDGLPGDDVERMAHDLGLSACVLRDVVAQGPHGADLLYDRLKAEGVSPADIDRIAFGLMRDLERDCACCASKAECAQDLDVQPTSPGWMAYCANAGTIEAVRRSKGRAAI